MFTKPLFADILILEEENDIVRNLRAVLQSAAYTVRTCSSMEKSLEMLSAQKPDLILLSSSLPDVSNPDAIRLIRSKLGKTFVPLIVMATAQNQSERTAGLNAGADEFIGKPVDNSELLPRVRAMLRLKAATDALDEMNVNLEKKVQERTQQLEKAHANLRHAEKLSSLGRLSASIAHEINNPLSSIFLYLELIQESLPAGSPLHQDLARINRELSVIRNLAQQLRDYSKPPRKDRYEVNLNSILEEVLTLVGKQLEKHHIRLQVTLDPNLPSIVASPEQIGEVFMNMILNAQDAMEGEGTLTLSTLANGHLARVQIKDTGAGMTQEVADRIFEPFFTTKGDKGTGLGLAICHSIVQDHGGEIKVESQPGRGATFDIFFPAVAEK